MTRRLRRSWAPAVGIALAILVVIAGFAFTKAQSDRAIDKGREAAIEAATRESERADDAICRIAATNRTQSVVLLVAFQEAIVARPNEDPVRQAENVALVERLLADARAPFPPPCTRYTPTL